MPTSGTTVSSSAYGGTAIWAAEGTSRVKYNGRQVVRPDEMRGMDNTVEAARGDGSDCKALPAPN